jgi:hypothetical protein
MDNYVRDCARYLPNVSVSDAGKTLVTVADLFDATYSMLSNGMIMPEWTELYKMEICHLE